MARTTNDIQQAMIDGLLAERPDLSPSGVAEWRLWTRVVASAIHLFEVLLDRFRVEMEEVADKVTPGTARWYADQCRRFQNGHELLFDEHSTQLYYAEDDPATRIIDVVAVTEGAGVLSIKVAKMDGGKVVPLTADELRNFTGYVESVKFAGAQITTVSTAADRMRYTMEVFYDPVVPLTTVRERVTAALDAFRTGRDFDARFYRQKFIAAIMAVDGVVTVDLKTIERKGTSMADYQPVGVAEELEAGYFDYSNDCVLTFTSSKRA